METVKFNKQRRLTNKFKLNKEDVVCYLNGKAMSKENLESYMEKHNKKYRSRPNKKKK